MRENSSERRDGVEIDLQKLLLAYLRKWWLIVLCGIIVAGGALYYTAYHITPTYRANVSIYVNSTKSTEQVDAVNGSNLSTAQRLVSTYVNIIRSDRVLDKVCAALDDAYTAAQLRSSMSAAQMGSTEIFEIYIYNTDPKMAAHIANTVADVAPAEIAALVEGSSARIIDYAKVPTTRYSPDFTKNTILGGVIGVVLAIIYVTIMHLLDVRIKDEEDLNALFDLPILGQIPVFTVAEVRKGYGYEKKGYGYSADRNTSGKAR